MLSAIYFLVGLSAGANDTPVHLSCELGDKIEFALNEAAGTVSYVAITPEGLAVHASLPAVFSPRQVFWKEPTNASLRTLYTINRKTLAISREYLVGDGV